MMEEIDKYNDPDTGYGDEADIKSLSPIIDPVKIGEALQKLFSEVPPKQCDCGSCGGIKPGEAIEPDERNAGVNPSEFFFGGFDIQGPELSEEDENDDDDE